MLSTASHRPLLSQLMLLQLLAGCVKTRSQRSINTSLQRTSKVIWEQTASQGGRILHGREFNVTSASGEHCSRRHSPFHALIEGRVSLLPLCCAVQSSTSFQWAGFPKSSLHVGYLTQCNSAVHASKGISISLAIL